MKQTIANFTLAIQLLESLINDDSSHQATTLVICSTRQAFLRQIAPAILTPQSPPQPDEIPASQEDLEQDDPPPQEPPDLQHPFLVPKLGLLAAAKALNLAFCPTIKSLRAFLSTYAAPPSRPASTDDSHVARSLVILDLLRLHRDTSEFSVQGFSRTFACAVEAAARNGLDVRLVECHVSHDMRDVSCGPGLWNAQVPLLNGSVRLGGDGVNWTGRSTSVKQVASRWFRFEEKRPGTASEAMQGEDEEMLV